jgi:cytochrome c
MRKTVLTLISIAFVLGSCGDKKKEEVKKEVETKVEAESNIKTVADYVAQGEKLFTEKTCTTCHQIETKVIGPSVKDIMKIYRENNANIVDFLKGNLEPIVDKDPGQVAIMKANLDGFVKDLTAEEVAAIAAYMGSVE